MNTLRNWVFKKMMWLLLVLMICAAIYLAVWKLASILMLLIIASPFAYALIWKGKQVVKHVIPAPTDTHKFNI